MKDSKIKHFTFYIRNAFRFFELKNELFTPIIFAVLLLIMLASGFWRFNYIEQNSYTINEKLNESMEFFSSFASLSEQPEQMESFINQNNEEFNAFISSNVEVLLIALKTYLAIVFSQILAFFIYKLYMTYYLFEFRKDKAKTKVMSIYVRRLPKIIGYNMIYYMVLIIGLIITGIPIAIITLLLASVLGMSLGTMGIVITINLVFIGYLILFIFINALFLFKDCYIIDKNTSLIETLKTCIHMTKGNRKNIARNIILIHFLILLPTFFVTSTSLVTIFVTVFIGIIVTLIYQRLIVLMYLDMNYSNEELNAN